MKFFRRKKHSLLAWILYTLVTILLPILTYYKFDINETQAWIGIACFITQDLLHPLGIVITSFNISLISLRDISSFTAINRQKTIRFKSAHGFLRYRDHLKPTQNEDERLYQLHYLITHEKWDEAITFMQKSLSKMF